MDYHVIATLGPSSGTPEAWQALREAGATAFRLNTSHLDLEELSAWVGRLSAFMDSSKASPPKTAPLQPSPSVYLDLQGSKWRLGQFGAFELVEDQLVELELSSATTRSGVLPVPHADFFRAAPESSGEIVLDDAKIRLALQSSGVESALARVTLGGRISSNKGITFSASDYRTESLSEKDRAILKSTRDLAWVRYAISYVKDADEMLRFRKMIGSSTYLAAKLERAPSMDEGAQIAQNADELWVCRGDLGAEIGLRAMAESVHTFSSHVRAISKPVIMAGQVLEHLTGQVTPTRSEICYLYDTLALGYQGFVLSDETAIGYNPVESVRIASLFK